MTRLMGRSIHIAVAPLPSSAADMKMVGQRVMSPDEVRKSHKDFKTPLIDYISHSRLLVVVSMPLIYICLVPFLFLDVLLSLYQEVCFPIYGIPKVQRADYFIFDRSKLSYLNIMERLNCTYCSYANGLISYVAEIAGRTEQHWCPIKHAHQVATPHSRYDGFLTYGDATAYRKQLDEVRQNFHDLNPLKSAPDRLGGKRPWVTTKEMAPPGAR